VSHSLFVDAQGPERGPVLVLQHGFAGSARNWRPQMRALRERARIVAFDARGHARSARQFTPARYALADFVRDFGDVAEDAAAGAPVIAGGLSLGAAVALHFALAAPARVSALVLAAIAPGAGRGISAHAEAFAAALDAHGVEVAGEQFVWGAASGLDAQAAKLVRQGFLEHPAGSLAAILRQTLASLPTIEQLEPRLAALDVPALVVAGTADRGSLEPCRALARALPRARLVEIEGAGHVVNLAAPDAFNAALGELLDDLHDAEAKPGA
jgi:pimeloyl-ACP methyl ester carboxylesterase